MPKLVVPACVLPLCLGIGALWASSAAASLTVSPPHLEMSLLQRSTSITLSNSGAAPLSIQLHVVVWTQDPSTGADVYEPTSDLVFFPKIATIPAGRQQVFRVARRGEPAASENELTYRLIFEELPDTQPHSGIALGLRLSVPLFIAPKRPRSEVTVESVVLTDGAIRARVANRGNVHVVPAPLTVKAVDASGREVYGATKNVWYQLAHTARTALFQVPAADCLAVRSVTVTGFESQVRIASSLDPHPCIALASR